MVFRIIVGTLLAVWLLLLLLGKGGFAHILLLTALGVAMVEIVIVYRGRMADK